LKRASMRFWLCASLPVFASVLVSAQQPKRGQNPPAKRANEMTLAGLRPGRSSYKLAASRYRLPPIEKPGEMTVGFQDFCSKMVLHVDISEKSIINSLRLEEELGLQGKCVTSRKTEWVTGHGLTIGDSPSRVVQVYGEPTSRSPSTRNGQPLELLYYAFDWAGPEVPQVMEVVCTVPKDGTPGRVVEITLAAGSL
jgi:hypothetical protein